MVKYHIKSTVDAVINLVPHFNYREHGEASLKEDLNLVGDKLYCIDGWYLSSGSGSGKNTNYCYDITANSWSAKTTVGVVAYDCMSGIVNDKIYCFGVGFQYVRHCYDPSTDTWSTIQTMPTTRYGGTASVVGGKIYVMGGQYSTYLKTNECYDPITNTWETMCDISAAKQYLTSSVVDNKIYAIGGYNGSTYYNTNEAYTPQSKTHVVKIKGKNYNTVEVVKNGNDWVKVA